MGRTLPFVCYDIDPNFSIDIFPARSIFTESLNADVILFPERSNPSSPLEGGNSWSLTRRKPGRGEEKREIISLISTYVLFGVRGGEI
jgi:hypothetical protein